jgi:LmbE family N-acetylglucosaminyl deacetylase
MGGTLAIVAKYHDIRIITATKGERGAEAHGWHMEKTAVVREIEQQKALEALGISYDTQRWLGYTDGELAESDGKQAVDKIAAQLYAFDPQTVITFGADGVTGHTDHRTISEWATKAFTLIGEPNTQLLHISTPREWTYGSSKEMLDKIDFFYPGFPGIQKYDRRELSLSLPEDALQAKIASVMAHHSQYNHILPVFHEQQIRQVLGRERLVYAMTQPNPNFING